MVGRCEAKLVCDGVLDGKVFILLIPLGATDCGIFGKAFLRSGP